MGRSDSNMIIYLIVDINCAGTTVYDEPSLPDPVYQEINGSAVTTVLEPTTDMTENSCYNNVMVMTENSSYVHNVIRASKF